MVNPPPVSRAGPQRPPWNIGSSADMSNIAMTKSPPSLRDIRVADYISGNGAYGYMVVCSLEESG